MPAMASWRPEAFEVCLKPLIAIDPNEDVLNQRVRIARQRLVLYLSTPTYIGVFSIYGLEDLGKDMAQRSRTQRWDEMEQLVGDDL